MFMILLNSARHRLAAYDEQEAYVSSAWKQTAPKFYTHFSRYVIL